MYPERSYHMIDKQKLLDYINEEITAFGEMLAELPQAGHGPEYTRLLEDRWGGMQDELREMKEKIEEGKFDVSS